MKTTKLLISVTVAAISLAASPALATTGIVSFGNQFVYSNPDNQDFSRGWGFSTTGESITALGYNNFGFSQPHLVGIFDAAKNLLASVVVTAASSPEAGYLYTDLVAPLNLAAGTYYVLGTTQGQNDGWTYRGNSIVTNSITTYLGSYTSEIGVGGKLVFANTVAPAFQYLMVNFKASPLPPPKPSPVPEPATWLLMLAGFGLVGIQVRNRRQATNQSEITPD